MGWEPRERPDTRRDDALVEEALREADRLDASLGDRGWAAESRRETRSPGSPPNYWSDADLETLVRLARAHVPTVRIAKALKRSPKAVRTKASDIGLALAGHDLRRRIGRLRQAAGEVDPRARASTHRPIRITVDFDVTRLTPAERQLLIARLQDLEPPAELVVPKAFDPTADAVERTAQWKAARAALGWDKPRRKQRPSQAASKKELRRLKRAAKLAGWQERHFPRTGAQPGEEVPVAVARYLDARRKQRGYLRDDGRDLEFGEE